MSVGLIKLLSDAPLAVIIQPHFSGSAICIINLGKIVVILQPNNVR
jgi:hypothetical protein